MTVMVSRSVVPVGVMIQLDETAQVYVNNSKDIELRLNQSSFYTMYFFGPKGEKHVIYINGFWDNEFFSDVKFDKKFIEPWLPYFTQEATKLLAEWVNIMEAERGD